jgi:hypothetical protein
MSWFPKASTWEVSGWNHGYWTADNEQWYQNRLRNIREGAGPKSAREWRSFLAEIRPNSVVEFKKNVSLVCDKFLQGVTSYWMA